MARAEGKRREERVPEVGGAPAHRGFVNQAKLKRYPLVAIAVSRNPYKTYSSRKKISCFLKLLS